MHSPAQHGRNPILDRQIPKNAAFREDASRSVWWHLLRCTDCLSGSLISTARARFSEHHGREGGAAGGGIGMLQGGQLASRRGAHQGAQIATSPVPHGGLEVRNTCLAAGEMLSKAETLCVCQGGAAITRALFEPAGSTEA